MPAFVYAFTINSLRPHSREDAKALIAKLQTVPGLAVGYNNSHPLQGGSLRSGYRSRYYFRCVAVKKATVEAITALFRFDQDFDFPASNFSKRFMRLISPIASDYMGTGGDFCFNDLRDFSSVLTAKHNLIQP